MCKFVHRAFMIKPMKTIFYNILLKLPAQWVCNGSVQFVAILRLKRLFLLSSLGGAKSLDEMYTIVLFPWLLGRCCYGVEEAWYFTNAIAASSLQNSSNTITPSSKVRWSITGPSGSKPSNRFLTNRSLGVKS